MILIISNLIHIAFLKCIPIFLLLKIGLTLYLLMKNFRELNAIEIQQVKSTFSHIFPQGFPKHMLF